MKNRYQIYFADAMTGTILNIYGKFCYSHIDEYRKNFTTYEEVIQEKDYILENYIYSEVIIFDVLQNEHKTFRSKLFNKYYSERNAFMKWENTFFLFRLFSRKPKLTIYNTENEPGYNLQELKKLKHQINTSNSEKKNKLYLTKELRIKTTK